MPFGSPVFQPPTQLKVPSVFLTVVQLSKSIYVYSKEQC
jgi:hypothetical protein